MRLASRQVRRVILLTTTAALTGGCSQALGRREARDTGSPAPPRYKCLKAVEPLRIDGRLSESTWLRGPRTAAFVDIVGGNQPEPRYRTWALLLWDEQNLYVAAELEEPNVRATLKEHDSVVYHDNDFEVFIDPNGDGRNYFEVEINAFNTVFDLLLERSYREGGPARHEWDAAGLTSAVAIDGTLNDPSDIDRGWTVEMAIPWSALADHAGCRVPPKAGDVWRINFSRVQWPDSMLGGGPDLVRKGIEDNWVWSPIGEVDMHVPSRWGQVEFVDRVRRDE